MNGRIQWLEAMRGIAACWVLLHHSAIAVGHFVGGAAPGGHAIANGFVGVDFFFVLSGFIIAASSDRLLATGRGWRDYARSRLIRIYVPYLPVGIAMLAVFLFWPALSQGGRDPGVVTSLTLLPSAAPPALSVAWSLVHEILFYAIYSLLFLSPRVLLAALAAWAVAILAGWRMLDGAAAPGGWHYLLSPLNLCFLLGVATFHGLRGRRVADALALALLLAGLAVIAWQVAGPMPDRRLLPFAFAALIAAACGPWAQAHEPGRVALWLGAASYSIYLVHNPAISLLARVAARAGAIGPGLAFAAIAAGALAAGLLYYALYERRALALVRRWIPAPRHAGAPRTNEVALAADPPRTPR